MSSIIDVLQKPLSDENIIKKDYHTYIPYLQSYNNNDEIRISIQNQDLYVLPSESYIYVEGFVADEKTSKPIPNSKLKNNFAAYLFDEIRYELNGIEIDQTRYLGATSTIKNFVSLSPTESIVMQNAGWNKIDDVNLQSGYFNFYVPLRMLLGFAEDYNKILLNGKHELILLRNKNDEDLIKSADSSDSTKKAKLTISLISWRIPHVQLSDLSKLNMIKILNNGASIPIAFRSWDCHINPQLNLGTSHIWNVKLAANKERPRFILIAFQRENKFVHCDLTNLKVHLNSVSYPYDDLNIKFENERFAILYDMYLRFQQSYYMKESQPLLTAQEFRNNAPIIVVDVSHQNESLNHGPIDIKIEFETSTNIVAKTSAYCILIHDRIIEYIPIKGQVRKVL